MLMLVENGMKILLARKWHVVRLRPAYLLLASEPNNSNERTFIFMMTEDYLCSSRIPPSHLLLIQI